MKDVNRLKPFIYPIVRKNLKPAIEIPIEHLPDHEYLKVLKEKDEAKARKKKEKQQAANVRPSVAVVD